MLVPALAWRLGSPRVHLHTCCWPPPSSAHCPLSSTLTTCLLILVFTHSHRLLLSSSPNTGMAPQSSLLALSLSSWCACPEQTSTRKAVPGWKDSIIPGLCPCQHFTVFPMSLKRLCTAMNFPSAHRAPSPLGDRKIKTPPANCLPQEK